ncbi:MAG: peptide ABC transporter substrate-binding protein [Chloroflexi bacterium]|nr:MAG: peptide ABC transporter substrate-binding protein [Chloroflexota bacterium]
MTVRRTRIFPLLSLLTLVGLLVSACTQQGGGPTTGGADQADPNGELVSNMGAEPDTIDPQKESFVNEIGVTMRVYEALMTADVKTGKVIPAAAKDQPKVSSDGKTYTYTLRDGLKYSDGKAVTANDFKYGWTRLCDPATAGEYAFTGYIVVGCEDWNNMDPKKDDPAKLQAAKQKFTDSITVSGSDITFKLTDPAPYFNAIASIWVGAPAREDQVTKGGDKWTEPATFIGNGPFILSEWKHNEKMVFTRNPNYRNQTKLAKWTQVMINEGAVAFAAYRNNELDLYGVAAEDLRTIDADADLKNQVVDGPDGCSYYIGYNNRKAPFNDKNVRVAFSKSFDRDAYINDVQKIGKPSTSFISPGLPGYDSGDTFQKFDATAAKAALAQATPDATAALGALKITYSSSARTKTRLEWFQQQWKNNLNVNVTLDPVDSTTYTQLVKKPETLPAMFLLGWCPDYYDQQDWLTTVFSSKASSGRVGYNSKAFDDLVFAADKEPDQAKRDKMYQDASRLLSQDAAAGWIYYGATKILQKSWVKNYYITALGFEIARFTDVYVTKKT